jgi:hypothetical protein
VKCVDRFGFMAVVEMLQFELERVERIGVQQFAQLRLAEKLAKLRLIDRQRLRAALGQRRVAVVDEIRDVAEEQRSGEGRRLLRVGHDDADSPLLDLLHRGHERGDIENVAQNFAIRLQNHRKRAETRRDLQQVVRAFALLPERRPAVGSVPRQQQRTRGGLAKLRREHRA